MLKPVNIEGFGVNTKKGKHTIKLVALVDKGTLHIPHYNPNLVEGTKEPKLTGKYFVYGLN